MLESKLVLVVEDDPVTAEYTCGVLRSANYLPTLAGSLTEASLITDMNFGAIFLDLLLPETDHQTLTKSVISMRAHFPHAVLIVLSAYLPELNVIKILKLGADFCLHKPLTLQNVNSVIADASELNKGRIHRIGKRLDAALSGVCGGLVQAVASPIAIEKSRPYLPA